MAEAKGLVGIRPARPADCRDWWEWRNEATAREASFDSREILYADHERWFGRKLSDPQSRMFVIEDDRGVAIGYARFEIRGEEAEIGVAIDRRQRGRGYGEAAIRAATDVLLKSERVRQVVARIKRGNASSVRAFARAGFVPVDDADPSETEGCRMVYGDAPGDRPS